MSVPVSCWRMSQSMKLAIERSALRSVEGVSIVFLSYRQGRTYLRLVGYCTQHARVNPHTGLLREGRSGQRRKVARGYDARVLVAPEFEQPALVTCDQIIGLARFGHGQQKVVGGIGRSLHAG